VACWEGRQRPALLGERRVTTQNGDRWLVDVKKFLRLKLEGMKKRRRMFEKYSTSGDPNFKAMGLSFVKRRGKRVVGISLQTKMIKRKRNLGGKCTNRDERGESGSIEARAF